jgi:hypothetical protein
MKMLSGHYVDVIPIDTCTGIIGLLEITTERATTAP